MNHHTLSRLKINHTTSEFYTVSNYNKFQNFFTNKMCTFFGSLGSLTSHLLLTHQIIFKTVFHISGLNLSVSVYVCVCLYVCLSDCLSVSMLASHLIDFDVVFVRWCFMLACQCTFFFNFVYAIGQYMLYRHFDTKYCAKSNLGHKRIIK